MMKEVSKTIPELYGSLVFNDKVMRERLPKDTYKALHKTIQNGTHLELDVANTVARCHERMGHRARRNPFYPLVPADDRIYSGKA